MMSDLPKKSFSVLRRWGSLLDLILRTAIVLAIVVMLNYLGSRWFQRKYLSPANRQQLSSQTLGLLASITNHIKVTLYYDRDERLFGIISDLLKQYRDANPRLHVAVVDYLRDAGAAAQVKEQYKSILSGTNKNVIIFDCDGRPPKPVPGAVLSQYILPQDQDVDYFSPQVRRVFHGERLFNAALLAVLSDQPMKAYYVTGHEEHPLDDRPGGYGTFKSVLEQSYVTVTPLSLLGTNPIPPDCNLLILTAPEKPYAGSELEKVRMYSFEGGRLLVLANALTLPRTNGLEEILSWFGVDLQMYAVADPKNSSSDMQTDVYVETFGVQHPIGAPLDGSRVQFWSPRPVVGMKNLPADAPKVDGLAQTSPYAVARGTNFGPAKFPLAVAIEKGAVKNVVSDRGSTRVVAVGDSIMFANNYIEADANKEFLRSSVNWLLERTQLMGGPPPTLIETYRVSFTAGQLSSATWLMLAALPGGVLLLGGLVWLRRRK